MISVDSLGVEFGGVTLFKDISFVVNDSDKIALMGKNGAGKSTLLKIIAGKQQATYGRVSAPSGSVISYLPQHLMIDDNRTVFDEASQAFGQLISMQNELAELEEQLATRTDYESQEYYDIIDRVSTLSEKIYGLDDINFDAEVE